MKVLALFALVALLGVVAFAERTLVVVDTLSVKDTHSIFFKSLTGILAQACAGEHHLIHIQNVDML